jgi:tetratricopeptide (TPR) repeat protein
MSGSSRPAPMTAIDEAVEAYETARGRDGRADLEAFLPAHDHPLYLAALCELVRVDLEYGFEENRPHRLQDYERRFPELFRDSYHVRKLAFEEFRLRRQAGGSPTATEYLDRYGVDHVDRTAPDPDREPMPSPSLSEIAHELTVDRPHQRDGETDFDSRLAPSLATRQPAEAIEELHQDDPAADRRAKRRHPRQTSIIIIVAVSVVIVAGLAAGMIARQRQIEQFKAQAPFNRLDAQVSDAVYLLGVPDAPAPMIDEGIALCRQVIDAYGARTDSHWLARPSASRLSEGGRVRLRRGMGELLGLWARALIWKAEASEDRRAERVVEAERLIALAEAAYGPAGVSRDLRLQSASLARLSGRDAEADRLQAEAEAIPPGTSRERLMFVSSYLDRGLNREALALAEEVSRHDPLDFSAWLIRGHCLARISQDARADQCFSLGIELRPGLAWAHLARGLAAMERRDFDRAVSDLDRVLEIHTNQPEALLNRALANLERGDAAGAIVDLDRLLNRSDAPTRALFLRARAHKAQGDGAAAEADRREGLSRVPGDELSWVSRGLNQLPADPASALQDFRAARKINSKMLSAFRSEANVLSETLGHTEEAVKVLDQALVYHPQSVPALLDRAVLLARLGRREEARKDATTSLSLNDSAETLFRSACTFALTSKQEPGDASEALRLLALAIRKDCAKLGQMDSDPDLASMRDRPEFQKLRDALRVVCPPSNPPK